MKSCFTRIIAVCLLLALFLSSAIAESMPLSSEMFESYSVTLSSSGIAKFTAYLSQVCSSVKVTSCTLQRLSGGNWVNDRTLSCPDGASKTDFYSTSKDYSDYMTKGKTYRLLVTLEANGEQVTTTSGKALIQ